MSDALLLRWQRLLGFSDDQAAQHCGLELREYCRQRATRPSRQTALIACLIALYRPDLTKIRQALADLARPPATSEEPTPDLSSELVVTRNLGHGHGNRSTAGDRFNPAPPRLGPRGAAS